MATTTAKKSSNRPRSSSELPVYNRVIRNEGHERERNVRDEFHQQCGGGRRIFRKALGR